MPNLVTFNYATLDWIEMWTGILSKVLVAEHQHRAYMIVGYWSKLIGCCKDTPLVRTIPFRREYPVQSIMSALVSLLWLIRGRIPSWWVIFDLELSSLSNRHPLQFRRRQYSTSNRTHSCIPAIIQYCTKLIVIFLNKHCGFNSTVQYSKVEGIEPWQGKCVYSTVFVVHQEESGGERWF